MKCCRKLIDMILISLFLMLSPKAMAWDDHQVIMERMLDSRAVRQRIYPFRKITIPCPDDEKKELEIVGKDLHINVDKIPLFSRNYCNPNEKNAEVLLTDILGSSIIDEPDQGMDQDLPAADDPEHFRKWMGGETGPTSQGFRHMYFPGLEIWSPIKTLQFPTGPIGMALERIKTMRAEADLYFSKGDRFWGTRILLWELHYIQDLQQPFHVTQIPSLSYLPLTKIFSIVKATTHSISNYHYAYEGIALEWSKAAPTTDFKECFEIPEVEAPTVSFADPIELLVFPRSVSNELGHEVYQVFGDSLKADDVDLPNGIGPIDYFALSKMQEPAILPDDELKQLTSDEVASYRRQLIRYPALANVKRITCDLMKAVVQRSWNELDRAFIHSVPGNDMMSPKTAK